MAWNHYDLWLGFKGMNGYFEANLAYQVWGAFDRRTVPFLVVNSGQPTGLRGHDFGAYVTALVDVTSYCDA